MGIKTFFASLMMLITIAAMCSPLCLIWLGLTMSGSALVRRFDSRRTYPVQTIQTNIQLV